MQVRQPEAASCNANPGSFGRSHEHANRGCSPLFACSRRILPSPAEAGFKPPHSRLERNEDNRGLRPRGTLYFLAAKSTDRSLRLVLFAAFWSAVNRGLRPRRVMYFLTAKSTKNSPADAFAYFVPANVRNGRLFAGLQANRPRFLPLLAGPSFHGSGIGPGSFAAKGGAGVRRLFYGCLHRTGSQYPAVAPESGFKPLYAFCRAGFSSRDIGKLSTFHF